MSSTVTESSPGTKQIILDSAWRLLEQEGARVRMSDVADAAGISRQALYLHFPGRSQLFRELVVHMDVVLNVPELAERVISAPTGRVALERLADLYAALTPRIDGVARVLEAAQDHDADLASAWRDRMLKRAAAHRAIAERLAAEGDLRPGWSVDSAAHLISAVTFPAAWREMTLGPSWTPEHYRDRLARMLLLALTSSEVD